MKAIEIGIILIIILVIFGVILSSIENSTQIGWSFCVTEFQSCFTGTPAAFSSRRRRAMSSKNTTACMPV